MVCGISEGFGEGFEGDLVASTNVIKDDDVIIIYVDAIDERVQKAADESFVIRVTGLEGGEPGEDFFFGEAEAHRYEQFGDVGFEFGFLGFQLLYAGIDFFIGDLGRVDQGINEFSCS